MYIILYLTARQKQTLPTCFNGQFFTLYFVATPGYIAGPAVYAGLEQYMVD